AFLISEEASATFIDVGVVRSLTQTLHLLDLDHAESLKVALALVKVLELVTKEHVHVVEANATKTFNQVKAFGHLEHGGAEYTGDDMEHDQDIDGGSAPPSEDDLGKKYTLGVDIEMQLGKKYTLGVDIEMQKMEILFVNDLDEALQFHKQG
nr:hypothetical protein [Tanacetum cinerariifolium]